ncbi:hypothetical protein [Staphylococcus phage ESa1]|nr:hypothetical protein [Staphylococcus phage ESa1]QKV30770.1 hypothetical protein [Staphylococcus phage ESa1]
MIEIRLDEDYSDLSLKVLLKRIKKVAPRELTYAIKAFEDVDVNIEPVNPYNNYRELSKGYVNDLWIVVHYSGYGAYYRGEEYRGESLDEIMHDMFYTDVDPLDLFNLDY